MCNLVISERFAFRINLIVAYWEIINQILYATVTAIKLLLMRVNLISNRLINRIDVT